MGEITEAKLYEAFGLTPMEEGAREQEPAAPAAEENADHAGEATREPEANEPEQTGADGDAGDGTEPDADGDDPEEGDETAEENTGTDKETQTKEQRRANAARRRAQAQQEAVQKAVEEALAAERAKSNQLLEAVLAQAGIRNTATGEAIKTLEEFQQWSRDTADNKLQQDLKNGKLTREVLDQLISAHPAVQQAQQMQQQIQSREQAQQAAAEKARIDGQLAKIAELNPAVKGLADILAMDTAPAFRENVAKGMDFYDAYRLANMEAIAEGKARRAVQASQNNAMGKNHLRASGNARGSGAVSVPPDQMKLYRMMNPKMTDAQIQAHYNQYIKQGG